MKLGVPIFKSQGEKGELAQSLGICNQKDMGKTKRMWCPESCTKKKKKCLKNKMKTYMNGTARLTKWKFSHWTEKHEEY